ncbi:uncharacterized protein LOC116611661 [Nematostella vectensis]|uniref:uncharacterized protein LOC116611661 n=1 Tax=Nematostella vectensis TaxID=45351 RepID=UPI0013903021|nr:uncharacterized protein LOC116611661 [Nematostella vectensis]XP_048588587.1 uncharacterized protein LOC116611661 [Nematostella vectensis]
MGFFNVLLVLAVVSQSAVTQAANNEISSNDDALLGLTIAFLVLCAVILIAVLVMVPMVIKKSKEHKTEVGNSYTFGQATYDDELAYGAKYHSTISMGAIYLPEENGHAPEHVYVDGTQGQQNGGQNVKPNGTQMSSFSNAAYDTTVQ